MSIDTEIADRAMHREKIAALFKAHPVEDIESEPLRAITPHYQQRISELRHGKDRMVIQNRPRSVQDDSGRAKRLDGAYRWLPHGEPIGRDATEPLADRWPIVGAPYEETFRLT